MRLLVLGGTRLIGHHLVQMAIARGDEVTLLNRGQSAPGAFPGVEQVARDRADGLGPLAEREWDAVIDNSGYVADWVRRSASQAKARHYVYVSSAAVYQPSLPPGSGEDAPTLEPDFGGGDYMGERYGAMKRACELAALESFPGATVARAGFIAGPHDYTDRLGYWIRRVGAGGEVLAPGGPEIPATVIDARDLAAWLLRAADERIAGAFNAVGNPTTFGGMLETIRVMTGSDVRFTWAARDFLQERGIEPWGSDLPLWEDPEETNLNTLSNRRALAAGLALRPLADTVRDVAAWEGTHHPTGHVSGVSREREAELLAEWRARGPS